MTYTTEAERLAAREAFVELGVAIWGDTATFYRVEFDEKFPPLAPVRMTPAREWWVLNEKGERISKWYTRERAEASLATNFHERGSRVAEVEVREVGSEPEGVVLTMEEAETIEQWLHGPCVGHDEARNVILRAMRRADAEAPLSRHQERGA